MKSVVKFFIDEVFIDLFGYKILRFRVKGNVMMILNYFIFVIK